MSSSPFLRTILVSLPLTGLLTISLVITKLNPEPPMLQAAGKQSANNGDYIYRAPPPAPKAPLPAPRPMQTQLAETNLLRLCPIPGEDPLEDIGCRIVGRSAGMNGPN